jgi:hypothetical protein
MLHIDRMLKTPFQTDCMSHPGGAFRLTTIFAAFAVLLTSCATSSKMAKPLSQFSNAATDATTITASALTVVQNADQDEGVINASKLTELKERDVPEFFRPEDLLQRQLVLQGLANYATALKTLSGLDRSADIQKSFDSLKTSMESTVATINKLDTGSTPIPSGVVSGLVSLGSNVIIAYSVGEREKAIRTALEKSDSTVGEICSLLASELRPGRSIYKQLEHAYRTQEEAITDNFKAISSPKPDKDGKTPPPAKPSDLAPYAKTFIGIRTKKENSLALLSSLASAYRGIAEAHTALKIESETGAKSEVQLVQLSAAIDRVKFFYTQATK